MIVSAILAVRNGLPYIAESIDSMLGQSRRPDEVIVVDDGSTDATRDRLLDYGARIRVMARSHEGQASALMAGIAVARGDVLAFQDADDIWPGTRLKTQLDALGRDGSLEAVFGQVAQFVSPELPPAEQRALAPPRVRLPGEIASCMAIRRDAFDRIGAFDTALRQVFFYDWLARAKVAGLRSLMLEEIVLRRRLHRTNYGRVHAAERDRMLLLALRRRIARGHASAAPGASHEEAE